MRVGRHACNLLIISAAILAVYANSFQNSFHFDDVPLIVENAQIKDLNNLGAILCVNRGLIMATFALNYAIGGFNVFGYHVVNVGIHLVNALLLYFLVFLTLQADRPGGKSAEIRLPIERLALFSALLFALHPVQTQAVNYIVQRMETLASFFYLLALVFFVRGVSNSSRFGRILLFAGVILAYFLAVQSKEIAITLPAIILLYDFFFLADGKLRNLARRWPVHLVLFGLLGYFMVDIFFALGGFGGVDQTVAKLSTNAGATVGFAVQTLTPGEYLLTQFNVLLYYIVLLLVPSTLNVDYDFPVSKGLLEWPRVGEGAVLNMPIPAPIVSLTILLGIIGVAVYLYRKARKIQNYRLRVLSFFVFWFFIILSPTSSFVPVLDVIFEHRVYLASAGFAVVLVLALEEMLIISKNRSSDPFR